MHVQRVLYVLIRLITVSMEVLLRAYTLEGTGSSSGCRGDGSVAQAGDSLFEPSNLGEERCTFSFGVASGCHWVWFERVCVLVGGRERAEEDEREIQETGSTMYPTQVFSTEQI